MFFLRQYKTLIDITALVFHERGFTPDEKQMTECETRRKKITECVQVRTICRRRLRLK